MNFHGPIPATPRLIAIAIAIALAPLLVACKSTASSPGEGVDGSTSTDGATVIDSGAPAEDSGVTNDSGAALEDATAAGDADLGDCPNVVHRDVAPAVVEGLAKALGLWHWRKDLDGTTETELDSCDKSVAYRFGPTILLEGNLRSYAACVLAQGGVVEVTSGTIDRDANACTAFYCAPASFRMGLSWTTETSGTIFELDANGKPKGQARNIVRLRAKASNVGYEMLLGGVAVDNRGTLMERDPGNQTVLSCTP